MMHQSGGLLVRSVHERSHCALILNTSSCLHCLGAVILLNHAEHLANLEDEPQASLCTGHLSPLGLVQRIRAAGWLPHRVNVLGRLERVAPAEVGGWG